MPVLRSFVPFLQSQKALTNIAGNLQVGQSTRIEHQNRAPACSIKVEGDVNNGANQHLWLRGFPQLLESSYGFPAFSIWSLPPVCCSEAVHSTLSCLSGVIALYTCVYLNWLVG